MDKLNEIKLLFYNPKTGLNSLNKFRQKLKTENIEITNKELKEFYNSQHVNQVLKRITKPKKFSSIRSGRSFQTVQMDLIIYNRYKYNNYQYIFVLVDVYSRYAYARAMTNRNIETLFINFESIIKEMKEYPENIQCDNEFNTNIFNEYFKKHNINVRYSHPEEIHKNAIVERLNGTIAQMLQKVRITTNKYDWNNYLKDIIYNYNNTIHSTLKETPYNMLFNNGISKQKIIFVENPLHVNDKVKIIRKKKIFDKSDEIKLSLQTYLINEIKGNKIYLEGISRAYKPYELERIYNTDENNENNDIIEPKKETKENRKQQYLKREDILESNIIQGKRKR